MLRHSLSQVFVADRSGDLRAAGERDRLLRTFFVPRSPGAAATVTDLAVFREAKADRSGHGSSR